MAELTKESWTNRVVDGPNDRPTDRDLFKKSLCLIEMEKKLDF